MDAYRAVIVAIQSHKKASLCAPLLEAYQGAAEACRTLGDVQQYEEYVSQARACASTLFGAKDAVTLSLSCGKPVSSMAPPDTAVRVALLGNTGVGRRSIVARYVSRSFEVLEPVEFQANPVRKDVMVVGPNVTLHVDLYQFGPQHKWSMVRFPWRQIQGCMIFFDLTNLESWCVFVCCVFCVRCGGEC